MDKGQVLSRLKDRLEKERTAYEAAGLPEYVHLNKTRYFSSMRKQRQITRRIAALETAISILETPFYKVDVTRGILLGISDQRTDKDELFQLAASSSMTDRLKACQTLLDESLPIFKKEILKYIT